MRIDCYHKTGAYHETRGESCQDVVKYACIAGYDVIAIADGVTSCENSAEGAEIACRAFEDFISREQGNVFEFPDEKLAYLFMEHVMYFLETETGERGMNLQSYASTILGAAVERKSGRAFLLNLGDGTAFEVGTLGMKICVPPKRYRGCPCLTTTKDAYRLAEIRRAEIMVGEGLLLCTDGFTDVYNSRNTIRESLMESLSNYRWDELKKKLESINNMDDCSYVALIRNRD